MATRAVEARVAWLSNNRWYEVIVRWRLRFVSSRKYSVTLRDGVTAVLTLDAETTHKTDATLTPCGPQLNYWNNDVAAWYLHVRC